MSSGAAALVFIAGAFAVLALKFLFPFRTAERPDEVERGSTTIMPEDR